ncbi:MAG: FAD binding domain-containing protein [Candidatus Acidiferrales bacterium]
MYPAAFRYYRATSMKEAAGLLSELGEDARALAGGQSLIPLMKLRLARPSALVDLNFIPDISLIHKRDQEIRIGALARHAEIADSKIVEQVPILHDCAAGIADAQVRNRGTIGGSVAEADPTGDWTPVLLTLTTDVHCVSLEGERTIPLRDFTLDAYTTAMKVGELLNEVRIKVPPKNSGGAYLAFKRCPSVYASASVAVQLAMRGDACEDARIQLGCVGLTAIHAKNAEAELRGRSISEHAIQSAAEAAMNEAEPQPDMRGSVAYKRVLVGALLKRAVGIALRRSRGEHVEASHEYVGRN